MSSPLYFPTATPGLSVRVQNGETSPETNTASASPDSALVQISARAQAMAEAFATMDPLHDDSQFSRLVQDRLDPKMVAAFTHNDKKLLGEAYRLAGGDEKDLEKLDKLTIELGVLRLKQQLAGKLIASASGALEDRNGDGETNSDDVAYKVDFAHLAILGEMKRMAAKKHMAIELF